MGGGGAMRTVAKVASIGVATSGLRGVPLAPPAEQSVLKASRPVSAVLSSQGTKPTEIMPLHAEASWDMDDWEFAGDDELVMQAGEPMPRVVFGGVPSFEEAKAATTELKDAVNQIYLSSSSSKCEDSSDGSEVSVLPPHPELETKSCLTVATSTPSVPKHALQAFQFLSGSPEAQTVVASVVSDPNVWNAVIQNPVLEEFFQSQKTAAVFKLEKPTLKLEELPDSDKTSNPRNGFLDINGLLQNIKLTVAEMLSSVSSYLQNIFGPSAAEKTGNDVNGNTKTISMEHIAMGRTIMGLAVLVAMVIILKRV